MKPARGTIQWLAPHLSDGELQAIYEAVLRDVIGEDLPPIPRHLAKELGLSTQLWELESIKKNLAKKEQRKELDRLFGKETG